MPANPRRDDFNQLHEAELRRAVAALTIGYIMEDEDFGIKAEVRNGPSLATSRIEIVENV